MNTCPSFTQLQHYLDERLDDAAYRAVEAHAADCPRCLEALQRAVERDLGSLFRGRPPDGAPPQGPENFLRRLRSVPQPAPEAMPWQRAEDATTDRPAAAPDPSAPLPTLPGYEVLGVLGRGGMGVVYRAVHQRLKCPVALKMILAGSHASDEERARFRREAEAVARLRHPNIVQVYDVGEHEGQPYLALEYVAGGTLGQRLAGQPLPAREAASLAETLARALHAAHQQGVVHRDLKPDNILLAFSGEPEATAVASGSPLNEAVPKITDFGLAKRLDGTQHTSSGAVVGTPSYMAPEQAAGKSNEVGPAADIYGLGALLYQLLTGRPPFVAATAMETVLQVLHDEPVPPRRLQPGTPRDLETVCLKCLAKEPAKRYVTAETLADDLGRFLRGEPIVARPVGRAERVVKWARRRPALAGLVAVSVLALAGYVVGSVVYLLNLNAANTNAKRQEGIARDALAAEQERGYYMRLALAQREIEKGQPTRAFELLAACPPEYRGWEWRYLHRLTTGGALFRLLGHNEDIGSVSVSPDGQLLATAGNDQTVKLWDAHTGAEIRTLKGHGDGVSCVAFSPDSKRLASAGVDQTVRVWDTATGAELRVLGKGAGRWVSVTFSPDGRWLAGSSDGSIQVWDATTGQERWTFKGHAKRAEVLAFSPDSRCLASGSFDRTIKLWDLADGRERYTLAHPKEVYSVAFSPDGQRLASAGGSDTTLRLWDTASGAELPGVPWVFGPFAVAFSPDGRWLAYSESSGKVTLRNARTGQVVQSWQAHGAYINGLAFSPDGQRLVTHSPEGVAVWDVRQGPDRLVLRGHARAVRGLVFSPDGQRLTTASFDGTLRQWDGHTGHLLRTWKAHAEVISHLAQSPDGKLLASASYDKTAKLWDAETGREIRTLTEHTGKIQAVAFSPDGRLLATACSNAVDRSVRLWDVATGRRVQILRDDKAGFWCVAFSPDGERLATGSVGGAVTLWDVATGRKLFLQDEAHRGDFLHVTFSPDGRRLVSAGGFDNLVQMWDAQIGDKLFALEGLTSAVWMTAFSPDGRRLATCSEDGGVKLWDARTGQELLVFQTHDAPAWCVAFSPDGSRLASCGIDTTVQIRDARPGPEPVIQRGTRQRIKSIAWHPDGQRLAVASFLHAEHRDHVPLATPSDVELWDLTTRQRLRGFALAGEVKQTAFAADGRRLVTINEDGAVHAWDVATGGAVLPPDEPLPAENPALVPSPDGRRAALRLHNRVWLMDARPDEDELARRRDWCRIDAAWHAWQAGEAEKARDWFAAAYHLDWALKAQPGDENLRQRREKLRATNQSPERQRRVP